MSTRSLSELPISQSTCLAWVKGHFGMSRKKWVDLAHHFVQHRDRIATVTRLSRHSYVWVIHSPFKRGRATTERAARTAVKMALR